MDRVWKRMKQTAREHAGAKRRLSPAQAKRIIGHLCQEENVELPPEPALSFLAQEFVEMVMSHLAA